MRKLIGISILVILLLTAVILCQSPILPTQEVLAQSTDPSINDEQKNKNIIMAFTEAFNNKNVSALDNIVSQNIIEHRPGIQSGLESTKQFLSSLITAFPDFQTTIDHMVAEDDKVVVFTTTNGTHKGPFF